ncbi:HEAT repeat domain-containing protein [Spirillospora sp. NPDC047279]|uniref:HEAT repeat domain-containing protein n=1 Tax=Spirillospora sp. NPDC047279 TaxID=3155478 RepID=UPI0033DB6D32
MFDQLDEVDWASMNHAYGPATDVPALLRGLASADPAQREIALDGMYGAVHHQGDVYNSTLAAIPFLLELVADPGVPERGAILSLLASIGGVDADFDDDDDDDDDEFEDEYGDGDGDGGDDGDSGDDEDDDWSRNYRMAREAVTLAMPLFLKSLADPDAQVRNGAVRALMACRSQAAEIVPDLRHHLAVESEPANRLALVHAVGALGQGEAVAWLASLATGHDDPATRLAALIEAARVDPASLPPGIVPVALGLMDEVLGAAGPPEPREERPSTPTLVGALREAREAADEGRGAPELSDLVRGLDRALGDRVDERIELLSALLRSPDWGRREIAVLVCNGLIRGYRAPYDELITLVGRQLADPEPRLVASAASLIKDLFGLAAPVAGDLAAYLADAPREREDPGRGRRPGWITPFSHGLPTLGDPLMALARLGDARALPMLRWALERPEPPGDIGWALTAMGEQAAGLIPLMARRLGDMSRPDGFDSRRIGLVAALRDLGPLAAPAVPDLIGLLREDPRSGEAIQALGRIGPAARPALPLVRDLLRDERVGTAAARCLWEIDGDVDTALPVLRACLATDGREREAAAALGAMGEAAAAAADDLRPLIAEGPLWVRLDAAVALWRITGDAEAALPVLLDLWEPNPYVRSDIAVAFGEMGPAAGAALPLLRRELESARRHNHDGYSSHSIHGDELLLARCAAALSQIEP